MRLSGSGIQRGPKTLAVRYRRSPEGCFESGLVVPEGRGAPPWRDAPACELRRSRVPWSRCTFFALEVMTDPVAASAAPPERLKPCCPKAPLLPAAKHCGSVHACHRHAPDPPAEHCWCLPRATRRRWPRLTMRRWLARRAKLPERLPAFHVERGRAYARRSEELPQLASHRAHNPEELGMKLQAPYGASGA